MLDPFQGQLDAFELNGAGGVGHEAAAVVSVAADQVCPGCDQLQAQRDGAPPLYPPTERTGEESHIPGLATRALLAGMVGSRIAHDTITTTRRSVTATIAGTSTIRREDAKVSGVPLWSLAGDRSSSPARSEWLDGSFNLCGGNSRAATPNFSRQIRVYESVAEEDRLDPYPGFAEFVQARGDALTRTAYLLTGSAAAAEDLVQDALVSVATRWRALTASGDPEAYVRRTMVNHHVGRWRRTGRRESSVDEPPERVQPDLAERSAGRIDVMRALARLPSRQRAVIVLRYYEDLSEAETANILGCAIGTPKRR